MRSEIIREQKGHCKNSRKRYRKSVEIITTCFILCLILAGCGNYANTGKATSLVNQINSISSFQINTEVSYIKNGKESITSVTVYPPELYSKLDNQSAINILNVPIVNNCSMWVCKIVGTNNGNMTNVRITDKYGKSIVENNYYYDCSGYYVGNDTYVFEVPGSISPDQSEYAIQVGNKFFGK